MPFLTLVLFVGLAIWPGTQVPSTEFVLIVQDSVPVWKTASASGKPARFLHRTIQLEILDKSSDGNRYLVRIGEDKAYEFARGDRFWVRTADVYRSAESDLHFEYDLSVYEAPTGSLTNRIQQAEYLRADKPPAEPYYVSAVYENRTPERTCTPPLSGCAMVYLLGSDMLFPWGSESFSRVNHGSLLLHYELDSPRTIRHVHERIFLARTLVDHAGCYDMQYQAKDLRLLVDSKRSLASTYVESTTEIATHLLSDPSEQGEPQVTRFLYLLDVTFEDGASESIARRLVVWWPRCL